MNKEIRRGDLYYAELDPIVGSEQAGTRPVLVVSNDVGNQYSPVIVIVPSTSRRMGRKRLPTHVEVRIPELRQAAAERIHRQSAGLPYDSGRSGIGNFHRYRQTNSYS